MSIQANPRLSFQGIGASPGVAVAKAYVLDRRRVRTPKLRLTDSEVDHELGRMKTAVELADQQLEDIKSRLSQGDGHDHALILEAHRLMVHDPMFLDEVNKLIVKDHINAEWAVRRVARKIKHMFDNIPDEYFRERRADVDFVADRIVRNLMGQSVDVVDLEVPDGSIVVAHDLSPADVAMLLKGGKVSGFITDLGGQTSHTAIVARARGTPAVVGAGRVSEQVNPGDVAAIDGTRGLILINPTEEQLALFRETQRRQAEADAIALSTKDLPAESSDGRRVRLLGNMEFIEELPALVSHGAEGIGLYRTEFLFLDRQLPPTEEEHYRCYKDVLKAMQGKPVTIRTLDLGGDKIPGRKHEKEPNPAMGLRAIRYCLHHTELFRIQLRALLRASAHGNLRVMFPLISGLSELREARSELENVRSELSRSGVPMGPRFPIGIMVETPSAALMADRLAMEVDFFSIGTNDLIQYMMAIDRQNRDVAYLYRPLHLSVLRSIESIVAAARAAKIPVSMCGEMAGDPLFSLVLLALGLDELSMTANQIPLVKEQIRGTTLADARKLLNAAMQFSTAEEIERFVRDAMARRTGTSFRETT